jgi:hypothetical protein
MLRSGKEPDGEVDESGKSFSGSSPPHPTELTVLAEQKLMK